MKKKYVIFNLMAKSYLQNFGKWTGLVSSAKLFDNIGDAEDEVLLVINTRKVIEIKPVYIYSDDSDYKEKFVS